VTASSVNDQPYPVDERPTRGVVEREHAATCCSDDEECPQPDVGQEREHRQRCRLRHLQALRHVEQVALVRPVGDHAGPRRQDEHRAELAGGQQPNGDTASGAVQHQQRDRHHRQPVAAVGDELPDEEQPEVAHPQRRERAPAPSRSCDSGQRQVER
jgi:hypothetical protein